MKSNFKNLMIAGILTSVFMIGTQTAKAGLLMSDFAAPQEDPQPCTTAEPTEDSFSGLLISDFVAATTGILLSDRKGLLISDFSAPVDGEPVCK